MFIIIPIKDALNEFGHVVEGTDSLVLPNMNTQYLIVANAYVNDNSKSIYGEIKIGGNIYARSTSAGISGFGFTGGISLMAYAYPSDVNVTFNTASDGTITYKKIVAFKIHP